MIDPNDWRSAGGYLLEPNALKAVTTTDRNVVVAAGPGAGKTELLAQRADYLLRTGACLYPRRILAVSFKVDAARNLRERVRSRSGPQLAARLDSVTFHAFAKRLIDNYRPVLTGQNSLNPDYRLGATERIPFEQITFADLVPLALQIVDINVYARRSIRQTYSHVFLDEFQDCTAQQYQLIKAAFGQETAIITAVGDVKQRIMAWAGALDGVLKTFADDFTALSLPLYQNRRSAPRLRRMQNRMIAEIDPGAISPAEDLVGSDGHTAVLAFNDEFDEAQAISDLIAGWLDEGVAPREIAILVRQQPHLLLAALGDALAERRIAYRNEQQMQDLAAEPVAALIFNFLRVVADERRPEAYTELTRLIARIGADDDEALRFDSQVKRMLGAVRQVVRASAFDSRQIQQWRVLVYDFLNLVSRPVLIALSPSYQQGTRLDDLVEEALQAFGRELETDGDAIAALARLSDLDAIRFLTIHKCKGLEFERVVVVGVEEQLFWGQAEAVMSEFFVAVSRAKTHLVLTHAQHRSRPTGHTARWNETRQPHTKLLKFEHDD